MRDAPTGYPGVRRFCPTCSIPEYRWLQYEELESLGKEGVNREESTSLGILLSHQVLDFTVGRLSKKHGDTRAWNIGTEFILIQEELTST